MATSSTLHLSGSAAADLQALVQRPPDATEPITLVGVALLVLSVFGFTRTLQRPVSPEPSDGG
jgi:hypothetical protein